MPCVPSTTQLLALLAAAVRTAHGVTPQGHAIMQAMQTEELDKAHKRLSDYVPLEDSCGGKCRLVARETSTIAVHPGGHMQRVKSSSLAHLNGSVASLTGTCQPGGDTWEKDAAGHSCGSRIEWVVRNTDADTYAKAKGIVASQFLQICSPCDDDSGSATPPPTPSGTPSPPPTPSGTPGPPPTPTGTPSPPPPPGQGVWTPETTFTGKKQTCQEQWNNEACFGQFGQRQCYTCKERLDWMTGHEGMPEHDAGDKVGSEFFSECGACSPDYPITLGTGYKVVMRDDFEGDHLDQTKWKYYTGPNFNNELSQYTNREKNAPVSGGTLKITPLKEKFKGEAGDMEYTSARLDSKGSWLYGRFSFRARMVNTLFKGTWPALWMMPANNTYGIWPNSGEMDIMENVGYEGNKVHGTPHTLAYNHKTHSQKGGEIECKVAEWHVYTIEWTPDRLIWAVDSEVYHIFKKESDDFSVWPYNKKFYLIMNFAVGGDWGVAGGFEGDKFDGTQVLEVDWAQVEQKV